MVSNISDQWKEQFPQKWPDFTSPQNTWQSQGIPAGVSQVDFDALRNEVLELKKLLIAAKEFDDKTGQPHCEMDSKVELIKKIAKIVGVDLGNVFGQDKKPSMAPKKKVKR